MRKIIILILLLISPAIFAGTMYSWLGTGFSPMIKTDYPQRDDLTKWKVTSGVSPYYNSYNIQPIVFQDKIYIFNGNKSWVSSDALNWTSLSTTLQPTFNDSYRAVVFNDKMWVANYSTIFYSIDGLNWTVATTTAPFSNASQILVKFNNKLININQANVWQSSDGINWSVLTTTAAHTSTYGGRSIQFGNKLFVHRGFGTQTPLVWSSYDGVSWVQEAYALNACWDYSPLELLVYNNKLLASGRWTSQYTENGSSWLPLFPYGTLENYPAFVWRGHIYSIFGSSSKVQRSY